MKRNQAETSSRSREEHEVYLQRFDKAHFFNYVEGYVVKGESEQFEPGMIEWFIAEYFERHVFFQHRDFVYVPEFAEAIFELLHKHKDRLVSFVTTQSARKDVIFPEDYQRLYATLLLPGFRPSSRGLTRTILDIEVMHRRRMNKLSNRIKRGFSGLRKRK